ncbi:cysteine--tRNA ligase [Candidatus Bathyarchaeota archaeon]|nr:cysteine--tRNA ligase [Candidatus Bathyarchaeota archaeon]MBS7612902.1 cysteine--tRNA ligase [Candidatus Bathyarchaeota archaeon]MBS7618283.1 cysteine--tRNA ligase [Candidatus Bathyarchaeota archaeon]
MSIRIYNTMTRQKEVFQSIEPGLVKIYVCGPTVYDSPHLGHGRASVVYDILIRWLEYRGFHVKYVRNVTDVGHILETVGEDRMILGAKRERLHPMEIADKYLLEYLEAMDRLGNKRPSIQPRASGHIMEMVEVIEKLLEKGYGYVVDGNVYFDVSKFEDYGKLSGVRKEELIMHRVEPDPRKRNPADFALWKTASEDYPLRWKSPWGYGFPGWHIECSVMSVKYLGEQIDLHGGARELIFPHHENSLAQSEAYTGKKPFVKYWIHCGLLTINGEKMSKSKGNIIKLTEALDKWGKDVLRMFYISAHYRSDVDFNENSIKIAEENLRRLSDFIERMESMEAVEYTLSENEREILEFTKKSIIDFEERMDDDLDTPGALAVLFNYVRAVNSLIAATSTLNRGVKEEALEFLNTVRRVFGVLEEYKPPPSKDLVERLIQLIVEVREIFRREKRYDISDMIRNRLRELGVELEDVAGETKWKIRKPI